MRTLSSVGRLVPIAAALALVACEDATSSGNIWRSQIGQLDARGEVSVELPASVGTPNRLPALTCYTADPLAPASERVWFAIGSVQLPSRVGPVDVPSGERVLSNCLLEPSPFSSNRLLATLEGETPGWLYQFVVVY